MLHLPPPPRPAPTGIFFLSDITTPEGFSVRDCKYFATLNTIFDFVLSCTSEHSNLISPWEFVV